MRLVFRSLLAAASALSSPLAQAIRFSYPASADNAYSTNISFSKGDVANVTWDVVNTDPKKFSLYLWEFAAFPPTYELVAYNVDTETKQATLTIPCHVNSSPNWQFTMVNGTNVYVLYAQTARFGIRGNNRICIDSPCQPDTCSSSSSAGGWEIASKESMIS
ncbi:hypothetical protein Daus18300_013280 [Diaporthe australafricana]|uniref:Yeast cell wall synthesis Kre9/Knh1-like N-terminal domain-containing protein n=1 Tax=Diaporthe australafricana TaxID=127596 RepID=A0ABR3VZY8_9PEZI